MLIRHTIAVYFATFGTMDKFLICLLLLTLGCGKTYSLRQPTENYVELKDGNGGSMPFVLRSDPEFDLRNGQLTVVATDDQNELFEITGISDALLKDTQIAKAPVRLLLIRKDATFSARPDSIPVEMNISCASNQKGSPIRIYVKSRIYREDAHYEVTAQFNGVLPEPHFDGIK